MASSDSDATKQAIQVNILISSGVKGILVDPVDAKAIVPVIQRASAQGITVIPVDGSASAGLIPVQVATDIRRWRDGMAGDSVGKGDVPGMHTTDTVDIVTVISGEIWALVETGETLMKQGDTLMQRGTKHAWRNRSDSDCTIGALHMSVTRE